MSSPVSSPVNGPVSSDDELVPHWLRVLYACLRLAPMTEVKTASGLVLLFATAAWLALSIVFHLEIRESVLDTWLLFLSGLLAISAFGQGWKQSVTASVAASAAASAAAKVAKDGTP